MTKKILFVGLIALLFLAGCVESTGSFEPSYLHQYEDGDDVVIKHIDCTHKVICYGVKHAVQSFSCVHIGIHSIRECR